FISNIFLRLVALVNQSVNSVENIINISHSISSVISNQLCFLYLTVRSRGLFFYSGQRIIFFLHGKKFLHPQPEIAFKF
ncbi:hypothetical protein ACQVAB_005325, partial [Escherichia coli]